MRRPYVFIFAVALVCFGLTIYIFTTQPSSVGQRSPRANFTRIAPTITSPTSKQVSPQETTSSEINDPVSRGYYAAVRTPISFWGKVVDENGEPIAGASVSLSISDKIFKSATHQALESDAQGQFSLKDANGLSLSVSVSKPGYLQTEKSKGVCGYAVHAATDIPIPTASAPAIFVLRKRGIAAQLIVRSKNIPFTGDGKPIAISVSEDINGARTQNDVIVQTWLSNTVASNAHYTWTCRVSVPGGGIQLRRDTFDFNAPENGYRDSQAVGMDVNAASWSPQGSAEYFVKLPDNHYARLNLRVTTNGDRFLTIVSYVNPKPGSRNLEYDSTQQIASGKK